MSQVHDRLLDHYRAKSNLRETKTMKIESIVKQSIHRKQNEEDILSPYSDFLRNEEHLAA
jgi:precorrin-4 methylase